MQSGDQSGELSGESTPLQLSTTAAVPENSGNPFPSSGGSTGPSRTLAKPSHTPNRILIGLLLGIVLGLLVNWIAQGDAGLQAWADTLVSVAEVVGRLFLRLMFMVVLPLVISALALAVYEIGDVAALGRLGLRTLFYTAILSGTAVLIGVGLVNWWRPGDALSPARKAELLARYTPATITSGEASPKSSVPQDATAKAASRAVENAGKTKSLADTLVDLLPENPLQEMVGAVDGSSKGNGMLAVMVFSLICGIAMTAKPQETATFADFLRGLGSISMTVIGWAMRLAPVGAGCLVFAITARLGFDILWTLAWFVMTTLTALSLHLLVTYPLVLWLGAGVAPLVFFRGAREAMLVAFGTASSSATLPTAMRVAQENLGVPARVANFVLTVGATGNQNGTALFEGVVVLFLAQVTGVELSLPQQFMVVLMSILAGVGTAGVPGGSLPLIVVVLQSLGIPGATIGIVLGVDRLLDMCRTVVNVTGDLVITVCVAKSELRHQD